MCGDYTATGKISQWADFFNWLSKQDYKKKILIAGNHDNFMETGFPKTQEEADELREVLEFLEIHEGKEDADFEYLCDFGTEFEGLKIWGSPWSVLFNGVNPKCTAFMQPESALQNKFEKIPEDIDILMTHTPPYLVLDDNKYGRACGSMMLRMNLDERVKPKLHFFGHIHEQHGKDIIFKRPGVSLENTTQCFNVSYVDENYSPTNEVRRFEL